jgi:hypothetical protein
MSKKITVSSKQDLLMYSLTDFFRNEGNLNKMLPIIYGQSSISLRILDWFVTNYSKKRNIMIEQPNVLNPQQNKKFIVYLDYKSQLKAYSKKQFDPFCRRERIIFLDHSKNEIETTVGQLNFFRWAIDNHIIEYVEKHLEEIELDMNQSIRNLYKKNGGTRTTSTASIQNNNILLNTVQTVQTNQVNPTGQTIKQTKQSILLTNNNNANETNDSNGKKRRKRKELSISATKTVNKHDIKIVVKFE